MELHLTPDTRLSATEVEFKAANYSPIIGDIILNFQTTYPNSPSLFYNLTYLSLGTRRSFSGSATFVAARLVSLS